MPAGIVQGLWIAISSLLAVGSQHCACMPSTRPCATSAQHAAQQVRAVPSQQRLTCRGCKSGEASLQLQITPAWGLQVALLSKLRAAGLSGLCHWPGWPPLVVWLGMYAWYDGPTAQVQAHERALHDCATLKQQDIMLPPHAQ